MNEEYILFSKKGNNAKITYDNKNEIIISSFQIVYYISGKLYLCFKIKKQDSENIPSPKSIIFDGETEEGFKFNVDILNDFNENPFHFKFFDSASKRIQISKPLTLIKNNDEKTKLLRQYFTNFLFDYNTTNTNGFLIKINSKDFKFKNVPDYKDVKEIINITNIPKITGFMESNLDDDYKEQKIISKNIIDLLSYSQRQFIQVIYEEQINDKNEIEKITIYPEVLRPARAGFTLVESSIVYEQDQSIIKFIEETYEKYAEWKGKIKVDYPLTYYLLAFIPKQGEVEYILVFTAIESLLRRYEDYFLEQKSYSIQDIKQEQFREKIQSILNFKKEELDILTNPENKFFYPSLSFDESLNIIYKGKITSKYKDDSFGFNLKRDDFDCKAHSIRNNLIHRGEFHDYSDLRKVSNDMNNIVYMFDKIFLTILNYKGYFRDYRDIEKWIKLNENSPKNGKLNQIRDVTLVNKKGKLEWVK